MKNEKKIQRATIKNGKPNKNTNNKENIKIKTEGANNINNIK